MEPRYGRLYAAAVLRPFAEQLVDALGVSSGDVACDFLCDGGTLTAALAQAVEGSGAVYAVDVDPALSAAAAAAARSESVRAIVSDGRTLPLPDAACDCAASLFTLGFGDAVALTAEAQRIVRRGGRVVLVVWDPGHPPAHELALDNALREESGTESLFLSKVLSRIGDDESRRAANLRDVVRFDGFGHYWAALVDQRTMLTELAAMPEQIVRRVRESCERALEGFTSADGTLRIPVSALALTVST